MCDICPAATEIQVTRGETTVRYCMNCLIKKYPEARKVVV